VIPLKATAALLRDACLSQVAGSFQQFLSNSSLFKLSSFNTVGTCPECPSVLCCLPLQLGVWRDGAPVPGGLTVTLTTPKQLVPVHS
jgi:hypothetical protein